VTGANCVTIIDFPLAHEGEFMPDTTFDIELPSQAGVNRANLTSMQG
jgi:hypothetical protein